MVKKLSQYNKNPITVSAKKVNKEKIKISLKQREINTENLARLINVRLNGNAIDHSLNDFVLMISSSLLPEMGIKLEIDKNKVDFTFRGQKL